MRSASGPETSRPASATKESAACGLVAAGRAGDLVYVLADETVSGLSPAGWANKALALGSNDPDAFVLVGHAERQAGHSRAALAAYRRYLRAKAKSREEERRGVVLPLPVPTGAIVPRATPAAK